MSKLTAALFWKVFFLVLIVFSWYQYSVIQRLRFGQMGHLPLLLIGGNFGGETLGNFGGHHFNKNNHWRHGLVMLLFVMLIIKLIKCSIVWQILAVDNVDMSVTIWFLSKNFGAEGTYFVVINSVHFHFQVSAHFQVFYNVVFVFGFRNTPICWTVENIAKEWNLVFIVRMRSMIFQSFMFISITFGTEWLFTILITTSKNHPDKQSPQLNNNYHSKQIKYQKKTPCFFVKRNSNKWEQIQNFAMQSLPNTLQARYLRLYLTD